MGADELRVERERLKGYAKGFGEGGRGLHKVFAKLEAALAADNNCWGDDDTGKAFFSKYKEPCEGTLKSLPKTADSVTKIQTGVEQMAKNYHGAEDASTI